MSVSRVGVPPPWGRSHAQSMSTVWLPRPICTHGKAVHDCKGKRNEKASEGMLWRAAAAPMYSGWCKVVPQNTPSESERNLAGEKSGGRGSISRAEFQSPGLAAGCACLPRPHSSVMAWDSSGGSKRSSKSSSAMFCESSRDPGGRRAASGKTTGVAEDDAAEELAEAEEDAPEPSS